MPQRRKPTPRSANPALTKKLTWVAFVAVFLLAVGALAPLKTQPFQASRWIHRGTRELETSPGDVRRVQMVNDLVNKHLRLAMPRSQVHKLLGMADVEDGTSDMGPIDIYRLTIRPSPFANPTPIDRWNYALWAAASNYRYSNSEPALELTFQGFGNKNAPLVNIAIK